jgi:hypothetical protein
VYVGKKERGGGSVREKFLVLMCGEVFMEKCVCKNQIWKEVVCNKYL